MIKSPTEESTQVSRVERKMTCSNCWEQGHNKAGCKNKARPQPKKVVRPIGLNRKHVRPQCASRGGGRGSRCDRMDGYSGGPLTDEQDEEALKEHLEEEARVEQEYMDIQDEVALKEHLKEEARVEQEYMDRKRPMSTYMQADEITPPPSKQKKDMTPPLPFRIYVKIR
nr:hypothetical protein [Tanacetum cinerariifolium]